MKSLIQSKVFWKAVIMGLSGIVVAALTNLNLIAYVAVVNMVVDIALRIMTTDQIVSVV